MNQPNSDNTFDVVIIGGGLSGLTSALRLHERDPGLRIAIMEASNVIGGQLRPNHLGELGAKWITEDQYHIYTLLRDLNVSLSRRYIGETKRKRYWELDKGVFATLAKYELKRYINELELYVMEYRGGGLKRYDKISMHSHIRSRLFFSISRNFMFNLVLLICGGEASDITFNQFIHICQTSGGIGRLISLLYEVPNGMLEFSSQELLAKLLEHMQFVHLIYGHKAAHIYQYREYVEVRDAHNQLYIAQAIILAIPWNYIQELQFLPPLPLELAKAPPCVNKTKYVVTSFLASYRESYWQNGNYSGEYLCMEPFLIAHQYHDNIMYGYYIHEEGIEPLVKPIILHKLAEAFGEGMLTPIEFSQHTFELNTSALAPLTTPWNRVIWSSSAAAGTCYRGLLGGAVQSGYRAAMNALLICRPQLVTWQDISEIHCSTYLPKRQTSKLQAWISSWNLYNISTYTMFISGLILVLRRCYRRQ
ncbi:putative monoamine oxidase sheepish [Musca autumnalis]|uniref:putative monoamine oxidase sheepish n=1 Tax=Musca autumnalis TaxID=221902 RepID=UPI003CEFA0FD